MATVICKNCGFSNAEGDEFCGSCGQYLEWSGVKADDTQQAPPPGDGAGAAGAAGLAAAAGGSAPPPPPIEDSTTAMPVPPPPPPIQTGGGAPPPPPPGGAAATQLGGRGPDVICWNCGRRNPGGRTFCIQCGERLAAGKPTNAVKAGAVAAAAGSGAGAVAGGPPPPAGGGPNLKVIGIGAGIVIALLIVAVVAASFLGGTTAPSATPTHGAAVPTPTSSTTATGSAVIPTATSLLPTDSPTVTPTDTPVAPTSEPSATPKPPKTPKPTSNATPPPPDATCTNAGNRKRTLNMTGNGALFKIPSGTAWCVRDVTFTKGNGSGKLKLFLANEAFDVSPYGWSEVLQPEGFGGSSTYSADLNQPPLPFGYDNIPPGTTIQFKITCNGGGCSGSVKITYVPVRVP